MLAMKRTVFSCPLLSCTILFLASSFPVVADTSSPYANKGCRSYSSYNDDTGKPVELRWGQMQPNDFGSRAVKFDATGARSVHQIPAPGVHPRVMFTPEDLPEIRKRLKETQCGQGAWKNILSWTEMMKGNYDETAKYAQPDVWKGGFGKLHGRVPLYRLGMKGGYNKNSSGAYQKLVAGEPGEPPAFFWNVFSLEAFRCMIDNDEAGAKNLASATVNLLKIGQAKRAEEARGKGATGSPDQPIGAFQLAFTYDFIYQWLTPEQRKAIHDELADSTWHHDNYGTFNTAESSRSNWATFSYWLFETLAIEGESGFNELKIRGMYRGWRNLLTYGWFQSGATYEGEAKNQLGMDGILLFCMREKQYGFENLCGHPYLRAYASKFLPHSSNPMQTGFHKYDLLGGSRAGNGGATPCDLLGLKYMFPNDKAIDWVYRKAIGEDYSKVPDRPDGYFNGLLFFAAYAMDYDPANTGGPEKLGLGNTFFCGERALMMTRSGWQTDAMMLNMHTRQANGGHPFSDRNSIMVAGAGRIWSPNGYASFRTSENSTVCIDGKSQRETVPGRMVDFIDTPNATFAVGDAKYCWDWLWQTVNKRSGYYTAADVRAGKVEVPPGWELEPHTTNDFALLKLPFAYLNRPLSENPNWILPSGALTPVVRQSNYPVQKAFRTAGLVRGPVPYSVIVDDIRKDDTVHHYDWTLALEYDIQIAGINQRNPRELDILLSGTDPNQTGLGRKEALPSAITPGTAIPTGQPVLLVRVLNRSVDPSKAAGSPEIVELPNQADGKKYGRIRRLVIPSDSVSPDFKVLIFACRQGDPLPKVAWNAARTAVTVQAGGAKDVITFSPSKCGKTNVSVQRDGAQLVSVSREITPLRDEAVERRAAAVAQTRRELATFNPESIPGRVTMPEIQGVTRVPGKIGRAIKFDGGKDGVALPLDMKATGVDGFTVAFWCLAPEASGVFIKCGQPKGFCVSVERGALRTDALGAHRWKGNTPLNFADWHHVAVTSDTKTLTVYVDGKAVKSDAITGTLPLSTTTNLGLGSTALMDDLRVYRRALTAAEMEKLYGYQAYVLSGH